MCKLRSVLRVDYNIPSMLYRFLPCFQRHLRVSVVGIEDDTIPIVNVRVILLEFRI